MSTSSQPHVLLILYALISMPTQWSSPLLHMSSVPEHQPPNPSSLILAIVVTISLYVSESELYTACSAVVSLPAVHVYAIIYLPNYAWCYSLLYNTTTVLPSCYPRYTKHTLHIQPIIDQIINPQLENLFGPQNSNPKQQQQQQQRPTTHRDLLLLYIWVIAGSCGFFPIWFYFFGGGADGTILKT